jgi:hypothetical protein
MIVNRPKNTSKDIVEFVSYTGKYPNLCSGTLTLRIAGKEYRFGLDEKYPSFWMSGGSCSWSKGETVTEEWIIDCDDLPKHLIKYVDLIDEVVNENIPFGCCGGCI